jgi:hypothetical protein
MHVESVQKKAGPIPKMFSLIATEVARSESCTGIGPLETQHATTTFHYFPPCLWDRAWFYLPAVSHPKQLNEKLAGCNFFLVKRHGAGPKFSDRGSLPGRWVLFAAAL